MRGMPVDSASGNYAIHTTDACNLREPYHGSHNSSAYWPIGSNEPKDERPGKRNDFQSKPLSGSHHEAIRHDTTP
jgi:hypothetical protein